MQLQILHLAGWQSCAIVLGVDMVFIARCLGFLYMAEAYGVQRHSKTARHPGDYLSHPCSLLEVCLCPLASAQVC